MISNIHLSITQASRLASVCISPILLISLLLSSCVQEETYYPNPNIEFKTETGYAFLDTSLLLGDSVLIGIVANTNSNVALTHFHYLIQNDSLITRVDTGIFVNEFNYNKLIVKGVAENETWFFYVRDQSGRKSDTISITFHKNEESIYGGIETISSIILGAQNNTTMGSFYSFSENQVYDIENAFNNQSKINLLCYYDFIDGDENTISSPGASIDNSIYTGSYALSNWTIKNTTRFIYKDNISIAEFDACNNDSLIVYNSFEFITGKRKAKNLSNGDIYAFVTEDGKKGLFKVLNVNETDSGTIEILIKMQD
ncbi:MAG: hypothetical protein JXR36_03450 [Bacteroidales bacterium]|nr:hypothetical protein [Bacteroidales bacterium]